MHKTPDLKFSHHISSFRLYPAYFKEKIACLFMLPLIFVTSCSQASAPECSAPQIQSLHTEVAPAAISDIPSADENDDSSSSFVEQEVVLPDADKSEGLPKDLVFKIQLPRNWQIKLADDHELLSSSVICPASDGKYRHVILDENGNLAIAFSYLSYQPLLAEGNNPLAIYSQVSQNQRYRYLLREDEQKDFGKIEKIVANDCMEVILAKHYNDTDLTSLQAAKRAGVAPLPPQVFVLPGALVRFIPKHCYLEFMAVNNKSGKMLRQIVKSVEPDATDRMHSQH
ncbi:hypothetical protein [Mageeibacillus indolicus]|jgi:hypothetical protein|uniref:hypothetical protein n=1 Tax=Mageeibacillus indolicus TaxID=884684 RepID=UPI0004DCF9C4|nr:hypothetical protein [Mageeibacillus indolicus]KFA57869.1 hypothetical protein HMPREF1632_01020 [Mageeibacillus indolicus 0009-5]